MLEKSDPARQAKFKKRLRVFSFKQHQEVLGYMRFLYQQGYDLLDVENFVKSEQGRLERQRKGIKYPVRPCPECSLALSGFPVNVSKSSLTGDNSKTFWHCPKCLYEEYSLLSLEDWQHKLLVKENS